MNLLERRRVLIAQTQNKRKSKNLFNADLIQNNANITKTITEDGKIIFDVKGGASSRSTGVKCKALCPDLKVGDVATLSAKSVESGETDKFPITRMSFGTIWNFGKTKTITQTMLDATVYFYASSSTSNTDLHTAWDIQIELGTEATEYEPYY